MNEATVRFLGIAQGGVFHPYRPELLRAMLTAHEGKVISCHYQLQSQPVSKDQRGYYFGGIIRATCMQTEDFGGWSAEEIDDHFRNLFCSTVIFKELKGQQVTFRHTKHISGLNKKQMTALIDNVIMYLANMGIIVLSPEEYYNGLHNTIISK